MEVACTVEVVTPEEFLGDVVGDLSRRKGRLERQERRADAVALIATVPLSALSGYAAELCSLTEGRGGFTVWFQARGRDQD